ncbi:MAG: hypothetical protein IKV10_01930, partial [Alphaproteobacteria bacterium]|nr:hypothetical protein [Alphaproteobacteria bacterium]
MSNTNKYFADLIKVCSVLPVFAVMPAMAVSWNGMDDLVLGAGEVWKTNDTMTVSGAISGAGIVKVLPIGGDAVLTIDGDISDFTGSFVTQQIAAKEGPNYVSSIVFKNWDANQGFNLDGNGYYIFDGNGTVKIASTSDTDSSNKWGTTIFLNGNALSTKSTTEHSANIYLGANGKISTFDAFSGTDVDLEGYNLGKVNLILSGSNQSVIGNLEADIENSTFSQITGMANNVTLLGDIVLDVDNVAVGKIVGQTGGSGGINVTNSLLNGNIFIDVEDSNVGSILGQHFYANGTAASGINGDININVEDSVVNVISGVSFSAGDYKNWNANYYKAADNINIRVKDSVVTSELLATGAYPSVGNVKIDVLGNTVIGYTDKTANTVNEGKDGWIIAGAQRPGARIENAEINLNTAGTIKIAGAINAGSREKDDANTADKDSTGSATLNMFGGGNVFVGGDVRAYHVAGDSVLNLDNITVDIA